MSVSGALLINIFRSLLFYVVIVNASRVLHNRMFGSVLRAPMRFFDTNPSGMIDVCHSKLLFNA